MPAATRRNDCTLLSLHNAITIHPTRPPPYPRVDRHTRTPARMPPLLPAPTRTPLHRQHDAVNAICNHSIPLPPHRFYPNLHPRYRALYPAPLTEPSTTSLNKPPSHPFSYPGVNQKTNHLPRYTHHLPSLRLPTQSSTQPPPALAPTSLTESSAP